MQNLDGLSEQQLKHDRLMMLRRLCPSCDRDQPNEPCTCEQDMLEIERIDDELRARKHGKPEPG